MAPVCCSLHQLGGVELEKIGSRYSKASRLWKALMDTYHYLGAGPLCGAQMRYLIHSPVHGYLGALAFSAAAWRLAARDRWIGWSDEARRQHLPKVVCNSRFLILPQVQVANLASHVLSLCARRIEQDWRERYGFAPVLLETFVERDRFAGTCYRAANWHHVGTTCGRGRQDRDRSRALPQKDVYVLPLRKNATELLCRESPQIVVKQKARKARGRWRLGCNRIGTGRFRRSSAYPAAGDALPVTFTPAPRAVFRKPVRVAQKPKRPIGFLKTQRRRWTKFFNPITRLPWIGSLKKRLSWPYRIPPLWITAPIRPLKGLAPSLLRPTGASVCWFTTPWPSVSRGPHWGWLTCSVGPGTSMISARRSAGTNFPLSRRKAINGLSVLVNSPKRRSAARTRPW